MVVVVDEDSMVSRLVEVCNRDDTMNTSTEDNRKDFVLDPNPMVDTLKDDIVMVLKNSPLIPIEFVHRMFQMVDRDLLDNRNRDPLD